MVNLLYSGLIYNFSINSYRERSYIFSNPTSDVSELDFMIKLWGEILELLIANDKNLFVKWGETSTDTTTAIRRSNNNNRPHTIGCKVDGRIVCQVSKTVDTCHIESARASAGYKKVISDKFKLAAEAKCTIDDIVMSGKLHKESSVKLQSLQIFGLQANVLIFFTAMISSATNICLVAIDFAGLSTQFFRVS